MMHGFGIIGKRTKRLKSFASKFRISQRKLFEKIVFYTFFVKATKRNIKEFRPKKNRGKAC